MRRFGVLLVLVTWLLAGAEASARSEAVQVAVVRLGEYGSLTGTDGGFGTDVHDGIVLAVEELNAAGGLALGATKAHVELLTEDDHSRREDVEPAVAKLLAARVPLVLGGTSSSLSQIGAAACQRAHVPMLAPAATLPALTAAGDCVFRACYVDTQQGEAMARYARERLKAKTAGLLVENSSEYSRTLADAFAAAFRAHGGTVAREETYSRKDLDFKSQLAALHQAGAEVLYVPGLCTQVAQIANQAKDTGLPAIFLGGDGWDSPRFRELGGAAVLGAFFTNHYSPLEKRPEVEAFVAAFRKRYQRVPTAPAALGYDAARLAADAIARAGSAEPAAVRAALAATKAFHGVTGAIALDAHRDAAKPVVVVEVTADGYEPRDVVQP